MPGSFFSFDRHSGFFLASFRSFLCLAAEAFWILLRRRVVVRLELGPAASWLAFCLRKLYPQGVFSRRLIQNVLLGLLIVPAIVLYFVSILPMVVIFS